MVTGQRFSMLPCQFLRNRVEQHCDVTHCQPRRNKAASDAISADSKTLSAASEAPKATSELLLSAFKDQLHLLPLPLPLSKNKSLSLPASALIESRYARELF